MSDSEDEDPQDPYVLIYEGDDEENAKSFVTKDGKGTATHSNGDTYTGAFADGARNGEGVYTFSRGELAGASYAGTYVNGLRHGQGSMRFPDTGRYEGAWAANQMSGQGTYFYPNGDRYCGAWLNGKKNGVGTYLYGKRETMLSGEWKDGQCPTGEWTFYDGDKAFAASES
jgi:hypothetical protein